MKILFFDIDGTILYRHRWMPIRVIRAIKTAQKEGNLVFLNTGRSKPSIPKPVFRHIRWDGLVCAGAYIEVNGKVIFEQTFDEKCLEGILKIAEKHRIPMAFDGSEDSFFLFAERRNAVKNVAEVWERRKTFHIHKLEYRRNVSQEILDESLPFSECYRMHNYADLFQKGCTKADGIRRVCAYLNVPVEDTVAFGDNNNDIAMLQVAGKSVAMYGAPESLQKVATFTATKKYIGVCQGIEKFILKK